MTEEKDKAMKSINIDFIAANSTLAYPIYNEKGILLFKSHTKFSKDMIDELKAKEVNKLYYYPSDVEEHSNKPKKTAIQSFLDSYDYQGPRAVSKTTQKQALDLMDELVSAFKDQLLEVKPEAINSLVDAIKSDLESKDHSFINLIEGMEPETYIYTHSLNVSVISLYFCKKLRLSEELMKDIGVGALLHDIGLINVSDEILNKKGILSESEKKQVQEHPEIGFKKIEKNYSISDRVKEIILKHHERKDGKGYPEGNKEVKEYIEIVALADIFDALTSLRPYRTRAYSTAEALKIIMDEGKAFSSNLLNRFVKEMVVLFKENNYYPEGTYVLLNTEELAKVEKINEDMVIRPLIRIISNQHGKRLTKPILVDLKIDLSREIVRKMS